SRRRHTRSTRDWSSDVCSSDLDIPMQAVPFLLLMFKEVFIGLAIGFVAAHIFWAMEMAGRLIDTVRGSSMAEVLVPESELRATRSEERRVGREWRSRRPETQ